jgi:hypothetical protein
MLSTQLKIENHRGQGKAKKLFIVGDYGDITTKYNVGFFIKF